MTYIIFDTNISCPLKFDSFVRDLDIIITAEPVMSANNATEFETKSDANIYLDKLRNANTYEYDIDKCEIRSLKDILELEDANNKEAELEEARGSWSRTDTETKRSILRKMLRAEGQESVTKWLEDMKDTSGITPMTNDEFIQRKVDQIESKYGITVTDEQRKQLVNRFIDGGQNGN